MLGLRELLLTVRTNVGVLNSPLVKEPRELSPSPQRLLDLVRAGMAELEQQFACQRLLANRLGVQEGGEHRLLNLAMA